MADRPRRRPRRRFNLRRVRIADELSIGALATLDVISAAMSASASDPVRVISLVATFAITNLGASSDDGQEIGIAHSDYQANEIEECLEAQGSIDMGNKVAQEQANRLVRSLGFATESPGTGAGMAVNNGQPIKVKLNWLLSSGDSLVMWVRNGSGTVYTTGAALNVIGNMWVKDSA